jgi:hypothetical protein
MKVGWLIGCGQANWVLTGRTHLLALLRNSKYEGNKRKYMNVLVY